MTDKIKTAVPSGYLRMPDSSLEWAISGITEVPATGLSIFFGDSNVKNTSRYTTEMSKVAEASTDESVSEHFNRRAVAAAYYSVICRLGKVVTDFAEYEEKYINYRKVKKELQLYSSTWRNFNSLITYLVSQGEFDSEQEAEDYLADIVAQQSREAVTENKVAVKKIKRADDNWDDYQVTVSNTSPQAYSSVKAGVRVRSNNTDTDEYKAIMQMIYEDEDIEEFYPYGVPVVVGSQEGLYEMGEYIESVEDDDLKIAKRRYNSSSTVWTISREEESCLALYDGEGNPHLADIRYDESGRAATVPIVIYRAGDEKSEEEGWNAFLSIYHYYDGWKVDGLTFSSDDGTERSFYPMDSEWLSDCSFAPSTLIYDINYDYEFNIPISTFSPIDITKESWGISFDEIELSEFEDINAYYSYYYIEDVYSDEVDITQLFSDADEAAKNGEYAYDLSLADAVAEPIIFDGIVRKPVLTLTVNGRQLIEGEDYKVVNVPYTKLGEGFLTVYGLGDYVGSKDVSYEILPEAILGDVDGDGTVTILDATCIQRYLVSIALPFEIDKTIADADEDGEISIIDATQIQRWLASLPCSENIGNPIKKLS